jgi:predicted acylesterase/phospholipase RssA
MMAKTDVRLALVMNGGISLAVWMGGVTHELDLLRRASSSLRDGIALDAVDDPWAPADERERSVYRIWKEICRDLDCYVTIDVIAGSSAGGLNGSLLARAIATGGHLDGLRDTWGELAALKRTKLLRNLSAEHDSILNGKFFRNEVTGLLTGMKPKTKPGDVSLFVTATAVRGRGRQWADFSGTPFYVPDHRRLYRFRRRTSLGLDEFEHPIELAAAARASAGFPVAFAPIREWSFEESYDLRGFRHPGIGEPVALGREACAWLMDGGVLDNAPFGPVLEEVAQQNVDGPWRRAVIYVVPSGDPAPRPQHELGNAAPPWTTAIGATFWHPRETDVRDDLEQVDYLLQRAARWVQAPDELFHRMMCDDGNGSADGATSSMRTAAQALGEQYRQSRTRAGILDALSLTRSSGPLVSLVASPDVRVAAVDGSVWVPPAAIDWKDVTSCGLTPWLWGTAVADRVLRLLLRHLSFSAVHLDLPGCSDAIDKVGDLIQECVALRDQIEAGIRARTTVLPEGLADRCEAARTAIEESVEACDAPRILGDLMGAAAKRYRAALKLDTTTVDEILARALMIEVVTRAFTDRERFDRVVDFEFHRFGPDCDANLLRRGKFGGNQLGDWKLWGTHFGHFGAFGAAEWRRWDWQWGRLDGAHHLFELLICGRDQAARRELDPHRDELLRAILTSEGRGADIPTTLEAMERTMKEELWRYRNDDLDLFRAHRTDPELGDATDETALAALQLLRHNDPNIPGYVKTLGQFASYALWPTRPRDHRPGQGPAGWLMRRGLRWLGKKPRSWLYTDRARKSSVRSV